ncbi:hypothetical protein Bbelb_295380 [Branchiostoma belcheri]|nr:hypothetical protein Bbelb_295380 [Branchiostoma belcheri]
MLYYPHTEHLPAAVCASPCGYRRGGEGGGHSTTNNCTDQKRRGSCGDNPEDVFISSVIGVTCGRGAAAGGAPAVLLGLVVSNSHDLTQNAPRGEAAMIPRIPCGRN